MVIDRSLVERAIEEQGLGERGAAIRDWAGPLLARITASGRPFSASILEIEAAVIARAIASAPSRAEAARRLGMTPQNLNAKLRTLARAGHRI